MGGNREVFLWARVGGELWLLYSSLVSNMTFTAHCRGGYFFCLDTKEAKNQVSPKGFFAAQVLALQNGKNRGWYLIAALEPHSPLHCKRYATPAAARGRHHSFRFHPKLPGLTRSGK